MDASAIFGFAGVIVGAGSTYVAQRGAEGRHGRADARVAVRLLQVDVIKINSILGQSLAAGKWWDTRVETVVSPNWELHQGALARTLLLSDWLSLRNPFSITEALQRLAETSSSNSGNSGLTKDERQAIDRTVEGLNAAQDTMSDLTIEFQGFGERLSARRKGKRVLK